MTLSLVAAPTVQPLTLDETKAHLRVDTTDEDALIDRLIAAAVADIDGADGWLNRAIMTQTWDLSLDGFPNAGKRQIRVPLPPLQSVSSITYIDTEGATQTLATSVYDVFGIGGSQPAQIAEAHGESWPSTRQQPDAVTVRFVAGYGGAAADVPQDIRHALLLIIGHWYARREETITGTIITKVPMAAGALLGKHRVWGFG